MVGAEGFEPTTPCAQGRCATRLRHAPTLKAIERRRSSAALDFTMAGRLLRAVNSLARLLSLLRKGLMSLNKTHSAASFLSAFLLALSVPWLAKTVAMRVGGVASAWTVVLAFALGMICCGVLYAEGLVRWVSPRIAGVAHTVLLLGTLALTPPRLPASWAPPSEGDPTFSALRALLTGAGLPLLVLAATVVLLIAWDPARESKSTLRPHAAGWLAGLLLFPFGFEPFVDLVWQPLAWQMLYGVAVLLSLPTFYHAWRHNPRRGCTVEAAAKKYTPTEALLGLALAACPAALLVAITGYLSSIIAPAPLVWVLPLIAYTLSVECALAGPRWWKPQHLRWALPVVLGAMVYGVFEPAALPGAATKAALYLVGLWVCGFVCHGDLFRRAGGEAGSAILRWVLGGGALAGATIAGIGAPRISTWPIEFPMAILACGLFALPGLYPQRWIQRPVIVVGLAGAALMASGMLRSPNEGVKLLARSFYGNVAVVGVEQDRSGSEVLMLLHDGAIRGTQFQEAKNKGIPTTYYGTQSGLGRLLMVRGEPWRMAVLGLGSGTLALYGLPLDFIKFFESDLSLPYIASTQFSYLGSSQASVDIATGDPRRMLGHEPAQSYHLIILDAFSGAAIPPHLLTREAFDLYFSKLRPDGWIAVNNSGEIMDLKPLLGAVAAAFGKEAVYVKSRERSTPGAYESEWVFLGADPGLIRKLPVGLARHLSPPPGFSLWTDGYANWLRVLR